MNNILFYLIAYLLINSTCSINCDPNAILDN